MLGGDPNHLHQLADLVREAAALGESAASVLQRTSSVQWSGAAADQFRQRIADQAAGLDRCVETVRAAADRLTDLGHTLRTRQVALHVTQEAAAEEIGRAATGISRTATGVMRTATVSRTATGVSQSAGWGDHG